jgi:hypothetical protein
MRFPFRILVPCLAGPLLAQTPPIPAMPTALQNGDFEEGTLGQVPNGWVFPKLCTEKGFRAELREGGAFHGQRAVMLFRESGSGGFGNLLQQIDATPYRGKRIRVWVRLKAEGLKAQAWLRVDRSNNHEGFFDNMDDRPVQAAEWTTAQIVGDVAEDAKTLNMGVMALGALGRVWADNFSLEVLGPTPTSVPEPAKPLSEKGVKNLVAFTKALGYVRFFHPSDEAAAADWNALAAKGALAVEGAGSPVELAHRLNTFFVAYAPSAQFLAPGEQPKRLPSQPKASSMVRWRHVGLGQLNPSPGSIYSSTREYLGLKEGRSAWGDPLAPREYDLGDGVTLYLPTICFVGEDKRTLPAGKVPHEASTSLAQVTGNMSLSADRRSTRLGDVALTWTIFQHFFPYFDVVKTDWQAELPKALRAAAEDPDGAAFGHTLRRMTAALKDGHVRVSGLDGEQAIPSLLLRMVDGRVRVTYSTGAATAVPKGSEILSIDGKPAEARLAQLRAEISAASEGWMNARLEKELLSGAKASKVAIVYRTFDGLQGEALIPRDQNPWAFERTDHPAKVQELSPDIWYLDIGRIEEKEFIEALPKLASAKGVIIDLRGYPRMSPRFLQHLTDKTLRSARWNIPIITQPDGAAWQWDDKRQWSLEPMTPRIAGKVAFLTGGGAISYAETCMGIVEAYKLAEIVGEPTAATNGNINPFTLPGGYWVSWTGMKVLKQDGAIHHGVGIRPTVPVSPTAKGLAEGRDEVLDRAIEIVSY